MLICSDEFAPLARAESQSRGMGGLPLAVVPHPLADNRPDDVRRKAEAIIDEVIAVLTDPGAALADRYRSRFLRLAERRLTSAAVCTDTVCVEEPGTTGRRT